MLARHWPAADGIRPLPGRMPCNRRQAGPGRSQSSPLLLRRGRTSDTRSSGYDR
jgi:hypothetical protein